MVEQVDYKSIEKYGIVDPRVKKINTFDTFPLRSLIEKPAPQDAPSDLAILGRYIVSPNLFELYKGVKPGVGGEIQLTDVLSKLLILEGLNALKTDAAIYDCGNKLGFLSANLAIVMWDPKSRSAILALFNKLIDVDF